MFIVFTLTFSGPIAWLSGGITSFLEVFRSQTDAFLMSVNFPHWTVSLIADGIIPGIGTVLVFLPQITALSALMSVLEDSGYMSRAAFISDRIFSGLGLTGSSFIPLLMGFGCTVPAIMSCRILPSEKDRKLTILMTSFMSCSARLPLYALFTGIFFRNHRVLVIFSLYLIGITISFLSALILNKTVFRAQRSEFVMEMPPYRLPKAKNLGLHTWNKAKGFAIKAGTTLLAASIIIWFLKSFTFGMQLTDNADQSILSAIGGFIAPIFAPLGFGDWRSATALLTGIAGKEMIVSTFSVISGGLGSAGLASAYSPVAAFTFLVFVLLYLPCVSAIITMKREFNSFKWTAGTLAYSFSVAWLLSFLVYNIGKVIIR
jgi:ferrous iron transport protein B